MSSPSAQQDPGVQYLPAKEMEAAFVKGGTVAQGATYKVMAGQRTAAGEPEVHDLDTDVFRIMSGSATFVTGGKVVGARTIEPGEVRGTSIEGGVARELAAGDVIVIPKGLPHWFKEVKGRIEYFVVKAR